MRFSVQERKQQSGLYTFPVFSGTDFREQWRNYTLRSWLSIDTMNLEKPFPTKGHRCSHCFKNGIETVLSQLNSKNQLQSTENFSFIILLVYTAHWKLHDHTQLSRLLAVATLDTCLFFSLSFRIARTSLFRYSFCKVSSKSLTLRHLNLFV